jgi:hypothetical protein
MDDGRPDLGDAALALAAAAVDALRLPLALAHRLPGVRVLARDGALVRVRVRSRVEGLASRALEAPEIVRTIDRVVQRAAAHLRDAEPTAPAPTFEEV